ncbi:catalase-related domain-containing protein [Delftia sp.]|uniref:catalase-related domain-containing protein n=1 Tax=Delftia sp. TaxID=1886637 RepID=UPI00338DAB1B
MLWGAVAPSGRCCPRICVRSCTDRSQSGPRKSACETREIRRPLHTGQTIFDSQSPSEQAHIAAAFRFELSKVTVPAIRERMVSSLRNVFEELANQVAG